MSLYFIQITLDCNCI